MSVASLDQRLMARKGAAAPAGGRRHDAGGGPTESLLTAPERAPAAPAKAAGIPATAGTPGTPAKVTLRLAADRHRRLRVVAACRYTSMQALMTAALDHYLAEADDVCACVSADAARTREADDA
jgi:hypothetical protein